MKNNRTHQVNVRLNDAEYERFTSMCQQSQLKSSDLLRKIIETGQVTVRYDGKNVIKEMYRVQDNMNQYAHSVINRIDVLAQKVDSLGKICETDPFIPFRFNVEKIKCEMEEIRSDFLEKKSQHDKELTNHVYF